MATWSVWLSIHSPQVQEPPELAEWALDADPQRVLDRVDRAHLVGDRTDAADARGDVRGFLERAAAEEGLEEAGGLEYLQTNLLHPVAFDPDVERALAFDPRQVVDLDRAGLTHGPRSPCGTVPRWH